MSTSRPTAEDRRADDLQAQAGAGAGSERPSTAQQAERAARVTGRLFLWVLVGILAFAAIVGVFLVGPIALITIIPALILIWFISSAASGAPGAGA